MDFLAGTKHLQELLLLGRVEMVLLKARNASKPVLNVSSGLASRRTEGRGDETFYALAAALRAPQK